MIDLKQFCSQDTRRPHLSEPFTVGKYTYATSGHICARVPKIPGYGPLKKPIDMAYAIDNPLRDFDGKWLPVSAFVLPEITAERTSKKECTECDGRGTEHDCPSCHCVCDECDGTGFIEDKECVSADICGALFNLKFLHQVFALPHAEIGITKDRLFFKFDGGDGIVMGLRRPSKLHVVIGKQEEVVE